MHTELQTNTRESVAPPYALPNVLPPLIEPKYTNREEFGSFMQQFPLMFSMHGCIMLLVAGIFYGVRSAYVNDYNANAYLIKIDSVNCMTHFGDSNCAYTASFYVNSANYTCSFTLVDLPVLSIGSHYMADLNKATGTCDLRVCNSEYCNLNDPLIVICVGAGLIGLSLIIWLCGKIPYVSVSIEQYNVKRSVFKEYWKEFHIRHPRTDYD